MDVTVFLLSQPGRQRSEETAAAFEFLGHQPQCPVLFTSSFLPASDRDLDDKEGKVGLAFWPLGLSSKETRGEKSWEPSRKREKEE